MKIVIDVPKMDITDLEDLHVANLLRPGKVGRLISGGGTGGDVGSGRAGPLVRALILTRLWVNIPCPHQMEAPLRPSSRVRSQPYPRLR